LAHAGVSPANATKVWDLKKDWSDTSNHNGPWSLQEGSNVLTEHVTFTTWVLPNWGGVQTGWTVPVFLEIASNGGIAKGGSIGDSLPPLWYRSTGTEPFVSDVLAGDVVMHSTDDNALGYGDGNVTWTSPITGTISISGGVWMAREIGRANDWRIYKNGALLSNGSISSGDTYNRANPFKFAAGWGGAMAVQNVSVVPDDVIKLEVVRSVGFADYVGVNLKIIAGHVWNTGPGANGHSYIPVKVPGGITWQEAENAAIAAGGHLVGMDYVEENTFVYSLVSGDSAYWFTNGSGQAIGPWLGGYQAPSGMEPDEGWQWSNGYGFGYTNWSASEPDNSTGGTEDRTIFYHPTAATGSVWDDYPAVPAALDQPHSYIIEIGPEEGSSTVWSTGPGANEHSYQAVFASSGVTWAEAEAAAQARGGHLVSVNSANENAFVFGLVSGRPEFWFDNATNDGIGPWIGGFQPDGSTEPAGGWQWADGSAFTFTNWDAGEPNNSSPGENRAHFFNGSGGIGDKWNDLSNSATTRGYIIEFSSTPGAPTGPEFADMLYVASQTQNVVYQYRIGPTSTPTLVRSLTDGMDRPSGLAAADDGLFVVQRGALGGSNAKISSYLSADDTPAFTGDYAASSPVLDYAHGVAFRGNDMLVVDSGHNTVRRFQPDGAGSFVEQLPAISTGITSTHARFVAVDPSTQEVFVSLAEGSNKVVRFLIDGAGGITANGEITGNGLANTHGVAFSAWGELFVASYAGNQVSRFVFDAGGAAVANGTISGNGVTGPINLTFSPWGELFVGNSGTSTISRFTFSQSGAAQANGSFTIPAENVTALQFVRASAPAIPAPCVPGVTTSVTDGLIGWWKGDGNADDFTGNNHGTEENGVTYEPGRFGQAFRVGTTNVSATLAPRVKIGHLPELNGASAYTLSFWVKAQDPGIQTQYFLALPVCVIPPPPPPVIPPGYTGPTYTGATSTSTFRSFQGLGRSSSSPGVSYSFISSSNALTYSDGKDLGVPQAFQWVHVAEVSRSSDGFHGLYINGTLEGNGHAQAGAKFPEGAPAVPGFIGDLVALTGGVSITVHSKPCLFDDVRIYTRDLTPEEILLISTGDDFNTCPPPNTGIPPLAATRVPTGVRVSWPSRFTGWALETSTDLIIWTPVTGTPLLEASDFALTTSATPGRKWFRLKHRGN